MNQDLERLSARLRRLEDRVELRELVARYALTIDDRDIAALTELFTPDARVRSRDEVMNACGREAVIEQFRARFAALKVTFHFAHDHLIEFSADPDEARGIVTAHAEVWRNGRALIAAIRYEDRYRRLDGRWRFAERVLAFLYYVPVEEYAEALGSPLRMRAYGDHRMADLPESLPSWRLYHEDG